MLCAASLAASLGIAAERVALVIGNGEYVAASARLPNPPNDARDLAGVLKSLGFLVIERANARKEAMNEAIREFVAELDDAKVGLFFYAGHAVQFQNNNYLLPVDVTLNTERDVVLDGVELAKVVNLMQTSRTTSIVILDACRNNPFKNVFRSSVGLADMQVDPRDTLIVYAAGANKIAYDGAGRNSIFTKHLLRYIATPNENALVAMQKVQHAVERETTHFKIPQVPFMLSSLRGFSFNPAAAPPGRAAGGRPAGAETSAEARLAAETAFWESVNKSRGAELEMYLERYPKGTFAPVAKARLADLERVLEGAQRKANSPKAIPPHVVPLAAGQRNAGDGPGLAAPLARPGPWMIASRPNPAPPPTGEINFSTLAPAPGSAAAAGGPSAAAAAPTAGAASASPVSSGAAEQARNASAAVATASNAGIARAIAPNPVPRPPSASVEITPPASWLSPAGTARTGPGLPSNATEIHDEWRRPSSGPIAAPHAPASAGGK